MPDVAYGVEWIEVEFGERPEGWKLYPTLESALRGAAEDSAKGPYFSGGGYCGPRRPATVQEILLEELSDSERAALKLGKTTFTGSNYWHPKWTGPRHRVP